MAIIKQEEKNEKRLVITSSIAEDLETEIILRLLAKSLLRFKSVCKRWQSLISSTPSFITAYNNHESHTRTNLLIGFRKGPVNPCTRIRVGVIDHNHDHINNIALEFPPLYNDESWAWEDVVDDDKFKDSVLCYKRRNEIHIMGPINGIYCIYQRLIYKDGGTLILWNPATRSYIYILPHISYPYPLHLDYNVSNCDDFDGMSSPRGLHIGFGYDNTINDYKIVVINDWVTVYTMLDYRLVRVYNNANNSWSTVSYLNILDRDLHQQTPCIISQPVRYCNSFLNGACHWACGKRDKNDLVWEFGVLAFDMAKHTFRLMRGPPILLDRPYSEVYPTLRISVWLFRETIAMVVTFIKKKRVEVWIMNEYGAEDYWDLLCSIPLRRGFDVVGIPNGQRIFLRNKKGQLISYGLDNYDEQVVKDGVYTKPLGSYRGTLGVFNYVESLASITPLHRKLYST